MSDKMCNECKRCDGDLCTYFDNYSDRESTIACILFEPKKQTVFDYITESVETLAEKLVYRRNCKMIHQNDKISWEYWTYSWKSSIIKGQSFETYEEAIAATLEELRREVKDE